MEIVFRLCQKICIFKSLSNEAEFEHYSTVVRPKQSIFSKEFSEIERKFLTNILRLGKVLVYEFKFLLRKKPRID